MDFFINQIIKIYKKFYKVNKIKELRKKELRKTFL